MYYNINYEFDLIWVLLLLFFLLLVQKEMLGNCLRRFLTLLLCRVYFVRSREVAGERDKARKRAAVLTGPQGGGWSAREEKGFNEEIIENAKKNVGSLVDEGFQEFKLTILSKEFIRETSAYGSFEEIKNTSSYTELSSKLY